MNVILILALTCTTLGVIASLSMLLQVRRIVSRKSSNDVSIAYLSLLLPNNLSWLAYGVMRGDLPLIISNGMAVAVVSFTIYIAWSYRNVGAAPIILNQDN